MKKLLLSFIIFLTPVFGQLNENLESQINKLFELSKARDYETACDHIAYIGENVSRKFTSPLKASNAGELERAERIVKKIKAYLDISDSNSIDDYATKTEDNIEFSIVIVSFKSGGQALEIPFKFAKANDKYLLVEID